MQPVAEQPIDAVSAVLGELPTPCVLTPDDVRFAVRAVVVHGPELWPTGPLCRNCRAPYPCRLHRWGRRVLTIHGLTGRQIDELVARGDQPHREPVPPEEESTC